MSAPRTDAARIAEHVDRLADKHPPIDLASADYSVRDPRAVRERFGASLDYMARVEMEVERNVLELAVMLPDVGETDRRFYADVWSPQEERHGVLLDTLAQRLGMPPVEANTGDVPARVRVLGALAHMSPVHEVIRLLYYLTGAATEKAAMLAYRRMSDGLGAMGETAVQRTVVDAIKVQEPGHFAFYRLSAEEMVRSGALAPWQMHLARVLRSKAYSLVGAKGAEQRTRFGGVIVDLGLDDDLVRCAEDVSRLETQLLWAHEEGLRVPAYALKAFRDAAASYRERVGGRLVAA
ncbi:GTP-binding protein LepA [uncultured Pseudokineococcus sp.]|uniref:GTP-binding protein LepA n=1 Tax=uncultured Pseudokineococcus sp. TaxID=1642928 RepID=UPI002639A72B|nr:GTP-binding protein LepA [uncultured Pseudokineococcus sp.]